MKRERLKGPQTPEEAFKGLSLDFDQRLVEGMRKLRNQADYYARMSNPLLTRKQYERDLTVARAALTRLSRVFNTPLGLDLLSMEFKDAPKSPQYLDGRPVQRYPIKRFLDLLPLVKGRLDAVTCDDIRTWEPRRDKEFVLAYGALELANQAGFLPGPFVPTGEIEDPPSGAALDVVARILSFAERKRIGIDTVRKRFPSKKQTDSVGQTLPGTFRGE
jgi:hypothetical protein